MEKELAHSKIIRRGYKHESVYKSNPKDCRFPAESGWYETCCIIFWWSCKFLCGVSAKKDKNINDKDIV